MTDKQNDVVEALRIVDSYITQAQRDGNHDRVHQATGIRKDIAALTNTTPPSNQEAALLREAQDCAYQAIGDIRYPPIGDSAQRRIERYQKLADRIEAHLKALPQ